MASTPYDTLLAGILILLSLVRLSELQGGAQDGHVMARTIVWLMWLIPIILFVWILIVHRRIDAAVMLVISIAFLIIVTLFLINGSGGYDLIQPDQNVGTSNGIYQWVRTDGASLFLPWSFYTLLAIALIYLTALSIRDGVYWILAGVTLTGFVVGAILAPNMILKSPSTTLGSLSTIVMLVVGFVALLLAPG